MTNRIVRIDARQNASRLAGVQWARLTLASLEGEARTNKVGSAKLGQALRPGDARDLAARARAPRRLRRATRSSRRRPLLRGLRPAWRRRCRRRGVQSDAARLAQVVQRFRRAWPGGTATSRRTRRPRRWRSPNRWRRATRVGTLRGASPRAAPLPRPTTRARDRPAAGDARRRSRRRRRRRAWRRPMEWGEEGGFGQRGPSATSIIDRAAAGGEQRGLAEAPRSRRAGGAPRRLPRRSAAAMRSTSASSSTPPSSSWPRASARSGLRAHPVEPGRDGPAEPPGAAPARLPAAAGRAGGELRCRCSSGCSSWRRASRSRDTRPRPGAGRGGPRRSTRVERLYEVVTGRWDGRFPTST